MRAKVFRDLLAALIVGRGDARRLKLMHAIDPAAARGLVTGALEAGSKEVKVAAIALAKRTGEAATIRLRVTDRLKKHPQEAVIVPVPLHSRRQRERGFNQAEFIAHALCDVSEFPVAPLLHRVRNPSA